VVVIIVEGGVVQHVFSEDKQVVIVDWDTEGCPADPAKGLFAIDGDIANIGLLAVNKFEDMVPELREVIEENL